jgi:hypothetical protein
MFGLSGEARTVTGSWLVVGYAAATGSGLVGGTMTAQ